MPATDKLASCRYTTKLPVTVPIFRKACVRAGIEGFRFHDLRHEYGSRLGDADVNLKKIAQLMGHSNTKQTERYVHPNRRRPFGRDGARGATASYQNRSAKAQASGMRLAVNC